MLVEIFSDIVCPWCAVGRARFAAALDLFAHRDAVEVVHRSFELDPNAPTQRTGSYEEHLSKKYGMSIEQARRSGEHLTEVAALDGLEFNFERLQGGNTFDAHRLLCLARDVGIQDELVDAFMVGYFRDGLAVGDSDAIARVATQTGLVDTRVREVLESQEYGEEVRADEARAQSLGITGVPFFLVDGRFAIPGAQPIERFTMGLERAWEKLTASP